VVTVPRRPLYTMGKADPVLLRTRDDLRVLVKRKSLALPVAKTWIIPPITQSQVNLPTAGKLPDIYRHLHCL